MNFVANPSNPSNLSKTVKSPIIMLVYGLFSWKGYLEGLFGIESNLEGYLFDAVVCFNQCA